MAMIIDGKQISAQVKASVANEVAALKEKGILIKDTREGTIFEIIK